MGIAESAANTWFSSLFRRKKLRRDISKAQGLSRCLTTTQLISLGVGATLGAGTYVVTGQVAANMAGPAVTISFAIAAFTSILSGLCYAEFGSRVPRTTGSAYTYSYVTVGEVWAFVIGWNLILEYMIGTAADAAALSGAFDYAIGYRVKNLTLEYIGSFNTEYLGDYPDFLSFIFTILVTIVLALGVRESANFTTMFNVFNVVVVLFIIITGLFFVDIKNWTEGGGFFPYGGSGVISGAATCFYAFVGFDIIATTGEEANDASKSIPRAIVASLLIVFVAYFGVSAVITLMVPYDQLDKLSPIPAAFAQRGLPWANYVISIGAICGLSSSLLGNLFPLPRIIYAMAQDGLLFKCFMQVSSKTEVPVNATVYPGILTAFFALLFDLEELVEMMSIGTLLAYTLVSLCVLILRYQPVEENDQGYYSNELEKTELLGQENTTVVSSEQPNKAVESNELDHLLSAMEKGEHSTANDNKLDVQSHPEYINEKETVDTNVHSNKHSPHGNFQDILLEQNNPKSTILSPINNHMVSETILEGMEIHPKESNTENVLKQGQEREDCVPNPQTHSEKTMAGDPAEPPIDNNVTKETKNGKKQPTSFSSRVVTCSCLSLFVWFFGFNSTVLFAFDDILDKKLGVITLLSFFGIMIIISIGVIYSMPQSKVKLGFMAPCVPAMPILAIYLNTFLMLKLSSITWVRFGVWMIVGSLIYCFYGTWNSAESIREKEQ